MFYAIGLITGVIIGYLLNSLIHLLRKGLSFKILKYEISINKVRNAEVVNIEKRKVSAPIPKESKCEVCNGEEMFIKGTKNLIACPKCNKNREKFKKLTL